MNNQPILASNTSKRLASILLIIDVLLSIPYPSHDYPINGIGYWASAAGGLLGASFLVYILYLVARRIFHNKSWAYGFSAALIAHMFIAIVIRGIWLSN